MTLVHIMSEPLLYFVEGNIAAGKSTFLESMAVHIREILGRPCVVVKEPVDEWTKPLVGDEGILQLYYKDKKAYGFGFQANVIISRMTQLLTVIRQNPGAVIVAERSPSSGYIFARQMMSEGVLSPIEYKLHEQWIDMSEGIIKTSGIVYLRVDPERCMERLRVRGRDGESLIEPALVHELHGLHEEYIGDMKARGHRVLSIDGNQSKDHHGRLMAEVEAFVMSK